MTATQTGKSQPRAVRVLIPFDPADFGQIEITIGKDVDNYYLFAVPSDFGTGYKLLKETWDASKGEDDTYHVNINGRQSTCACKGFLRWGHCKHIDGLNKLIQCGKLPAAQPRRESGCDVEFDDP